uniref:BTB domain-containing protein n=1 Tax=Panagrolaimus sp. JU765 TaxID=591449 RepID=A0AC34QQM7_9BILA
MATPAKQPRLGNLQEISSFEEMESLDEQSSKKVTFKTVLNCHLVVKESDFISFNHFISQEKQFCLFEDYWYYFAIAQKDEDINIYLYMDCPTPVTVSCICTINSITKRMLYTYTRREGNGYSKFGKKSELFVDGVLKLEAEIEVRIPSKQMVDDESSSSIALLNDERFKDFTIHVDGKEIKVHKSVLAVASPVFSAMLEPLTKEYAENKVFIRDSNYDTIKAGVEFMYTSKIKNDSSVEFLLDLYKFADKYDLVNSDKILQKLLEKFDFSTIPEIVKFSLDYSLEKLYKKCVEFFTKNFSNAGKYSNDFQDLDSCFFKDVVLKTWSLNRKKITGFSL